VKIISKQFSANEAFEKDNVPVRISFQHPAEQFWRVRVFRGGCFMAAEAHKHTHNCKTKSLDMCWSTLLHTPALCALFVKCNEY